MGFGLEKKRCFSVNNAEAPQESALPVAALKTCATGCALRNHNLQLPSQSPYWIVHFARSTRSCTPFAIVTRRGLIPLSTPLPGLSCLEALAFACAGLLGTRGVVPI